MASVQTESVRVRDDENLQAWQRVWRVGLVPQFTVAGLEGLRKALLEDRPSLITGSTMMPPPLMSMQHEAVEAVCPLCYALLDGMRPEAVSVGPMEERFAETCIRAEQLCGEPAAARFFLNRVDETPREQMRRELLAEVERALPGHEQERRPPTPLERLLLASIRMEEAKS